MNENDSSEADGMASLHLVFDSMKITLNFSEILQIHFAITISTNEGKMPYAGKVLFNQPFTCHSSSNQIDHKI